MNYDASQKKFVHKYYFSKEIQFPLPTQSSAHIHIFKLQSLNTNMRTNDYLTNICLD